MNNSRKLALSKETLRSLDDQDLNDVVGGGCGGHREGGGGHNNNNSFGCSGICVSYECNSGICSGLLCIA